MTSNIGSQFIQKWDGNNFETLESTLQKELTIHFRPEFINRIDDIVIFDRIKEDDMKHIVDVQLHSMLAEIEKSKGIKITFTPNAKHALAQEGYDEAFGARPLKRIIQKRILNVLARHIIEGSVAENSEVTIDYDGGNFAIKIK